MEGHQKGGSDVKQIRHTELSPSPHWKVDISNVGRGLSLEACVEFADLIRVELSAHLLWCLALLNLHKGKICAANRRQL